MSQSINHETDDQVRNHAQARGDGKAYGSQKNGLKKRKHQTWNDGYHFIGAIDPYGIGLRTLTSIIDNLEAGRGKKNTPKNEKNKNFQIFLPLLILERA